MFTEKKYQCKEVYLITKRSKIFCIHSKTKKLNFRVWI